MISPGGRVAVSVWRPIERQPFFAALVGALESLLGTNSTGSLRAGFSLSNRDELRALLRDAGWRNVHVRLDVKISRYPSLEQFVPGYMAATPMAGQVAALPDADRKRLVDEVLKSLRDYLDDGGLATPMECHVATAHR